MKTIKELENNEFIGSIYRNGYNQARKDVLELIDELWLNWEDNINEYKRSYFVKELKERIKGEENK